MTGLAILLLFGCDGRTLPESESDGGGVPACSCDVSATCDMGCACDDACTSSALCSDTCAYPGDGECDDGGPDAATALCAYGTDCIDCGPRDADVEPGCSSAADCAAGEDCVAGRCQTAEACACDATWACDADCACDPECTDCACDTDSTCQTGCACDGDCGDGACTPLGEEGCRDGDACCLESGVFPVCMNDACCRATGSSCDPSALFSLCCEGSYCDSDSNQCETCLDVGDPAGPDCEGCCAGTCADFGSGLVCTEP